MSTQTLEYWLTTSAVEFSGTKSVVTPAHGGATTPTYVSSAALILRADHVQGAVALEITEGDLAETKFTLNFADDGRLTSSDITATGAGAQVLGSVATIAGEVATVASAVAKTATLASAAVPAAAKAADHAVGPQPYPQEGLLQDLTNRQDDLAGQLLQTDPTSDGGVDRFCALQTALALVSQERTRLTQEQTAWAIAASKTVTQTFDYILDVSALPGAQQLHDGLSETDRPAAHRVWHDLGIMVTLDESVQAEATHVGPDEGDSAPYQAGAATAIWYRRPRRVTLNVWSSNDRHRPVLVRSTDVDIVDKKCRHLSLPLKLRHFFRTAEFSVTMGTYGTPTAIGADITSGTAAALGALAGLPKLVSGGISDTAGIGTAWQAVNPSAENKEIATLQATKDRLQLLSDIAKLEHGS